MGENHSTNRDRRILDALDVTGERIGLIVSDFNAEITSELERGAVAELLRHGVLAEDIVKTHVPGAFEIPLAAQRALESGAAAAICLGCIIRGETSHYDFICGSVSGALQNVSLKFGRPVSAGILTTENVAQARARCGGARGHKGREAALSALKMIMALRSSERGESTCADHPEKTLRTRE